MQMGLSTHYGLNNGPKLLSGNIELNLVVCEHSFRLVIQVVKSARRRTVNSLSSNLYELGKYFWNIILILN